jgi:hypothetical protein
MFTGMLVLALVCDGEPSRNNNNVVTGQNKVWFSRDGVVGDHIEDVSLSQSARLHNKPTFYSIR